MSTTYESFFDEVMPFVPGCTTAIAKTAIRNTVIDFCEKTLILQRDHDPVTVIYNIVDYDFEPPTNYLVSKIMKAWYKDTELQPVAPDSISSALLYNSSFANAVKPNQDPSVYTQKDERTYSIYPFPKETVASALTMRVALKPTRSSTTIEDSIFEDYAEVIGNGAKYRLMMSPNKPYFTNGFNLFKDLYEQGVNVARQKANRGFVRSDLKVKLPRI